MMFKKNVGRLDRAVRLIAGAILFLIGWFLFGGLQGSSAGVYTTIFGLALVMTGLFNFCMLYALVGISTKEKDHI